MSSTVKFLQLVLLAILAGVGVVVAIGFFQLNLVRLPALITKVEEVTNALFLWMFVIIT